MRAENGNFESGLAKNASLRKEKLHFTNKISSLQKLNVKKESYQVPGLCMGRGRIYPAQNHTMSTPKMPLLYRKIPQNDFTHRIMFISLLVSSYQMALLLMTASR